jgi:sensor histidine kinase YesM
MKSPLSSRVNFTNIQRTLWVLGFCAIFAYSYFKFVRFDRAFVNTLLVTIMYIAAVYGNSHFLLPKFFRKNITQYILFSILYLAIITGTRMILEYVIMHRWMSYTYFYEFSVEHFSFSSVTMIFAFLFGGLLRISIDYFTLLQHQEQVKAQQAFSELNLLKSQVQPHFLFNALNNIYYLTYTKSDKAPEAITRLSDTMRYFVDEAPKELVTLKTEVDFIRDFIEVERIRLPYVLDLRLRIDSSVTTSLENILLPSMLFIPFVENAFKHGIDKTRKDNEIAIALSRSNGNLSFSVSNKITTSGISNGTGTGLTNLRKRLELLYQNRFTMTAREESGYFVSQLHIPLL